MPRPSTPRRGVPVRARIVIAVVSLTGIGLAVAGVSAAALQRVQVTNSIDEDLLASAAEFRRLAADGSDPDTGAAFATADDLLRASMGRVIPQPNEGLLGFIDGSLTFTSRDAGVALEQDEQLIAELEPLATLPESTLINITTDTTTYRALVLPISVTGSAGATATAAQVLAYDKNAEMAGFQRVFRTYTYVAIAVLVAVGASAWLIAGRILGPVRDLAAAATRIGQSNVAERIPVTGHDELTDMTRAVNGMLDRLEHAFASQRALLDDVSHELRTPVTVIRGHLEVMGDEDVEETRAIALDELDRMNRLLEDLMTLAVSDSTDFVRPAPVEVRELTEEVFEKARALGERDWQLAERAEAVINADAQRITQAWLQLAANAVKFSTTGSSITIGSRLEGDHAVLWITDKGEGIAPDVLDHIFERFERGTRSRRDGAGLGLAIVSAIAAAHGGSVNVASTVGAGSTFEMQVPLATGDDEAEEAQ